MNYRNTVLLSQKNLNILSITKEEVIVKAKFGPSIPTRIPLYLDDKLAYFTAAIIGDGHLAKDAYHITIECTDKEIITRLKSICSEIFYRDFNFSSRIRENRKKTYTLVIDSKAIYNLLNLALEIPSGKKSSIVKYQIRYINLKNQLSMLFS